MTNAFDKSKFFKAAWALARSAAAKFGGSAKEYITDALRTGYAALRKRAAKVEKTTAEKVSALAAIVIDWPSKLRKTFTYGFILDNAQRVARYGEETKFSAKQVEIINDMYAKYAA